MNTILFDLVFVILLSIMIIFCGLIVNWLNEGKWNKSWFGMPFIVMGLGFIVFTVFSTAIALTPEINSENNSNAIAFCESMNLKLEKYSWAGYIGFRDIKCYKVDGFIETEYCFYDYPKQKGSEC